MLAYHPIFFAVAAATAPAPSPQVALDELLAADRAFSAQSAKASDVTSGLAPMVDREAVVPVPGEGFAIGRDAVLASMRKIPGFKEGHATWTPVRGGISADGTQGFTYGFLTLSAGDPAKRERKYLAYWVKRPEGWRVAAYRQQVREAGEVSRAMMAPSLPAAGVQPIDDPAVIAAHKLSVASAEKAFSDRAQIVGLRNAFREYGREDAMNMYSGAGFAVGLDAVTAGFKEGEPTTIHWSTEHSFAASSGDLGVSIGTIRSNTPSADGSDKGFPFFTVWRRDAPDQPWRYIAE
jgi:ketosteroid isomerase-like protein